MLRSLSLQVTRGLQWRLSNAPVSLSRLQDATYHSTPSDAVSSSQAQEDRQHNADFHRFADIYLGGLWNRFESELRKNEGDDFEYDVQLSSGCMKVVLPDDAEIVICKNVSEEALSIESNLHAISGADDPEIRDTAMFKLDDGEFKDGDVALHQYLEDHLAKHLNVEFDLEPQPGANNKNVYGPDPT